MSRACNCTFVLYHRYFAKLRSGSLFSENILSLCCIPSLNKPKYLFFMSYCQLVILWIWKGHKICIATTALPVLDGISYNEAGVMQFRQLNTRTKQRTSPLKHIFTQSNRFRIFALCVSCSQPRSTWHYRISCIQHKTCTSTPI